MEQASVRLRGSKPTTPPTRKRVPKSKPAPAPEPPVVEEWTNARATAQAQRAANARQLSGRRRFVDPTTCERDYTMEELEFMAAMAEYKKSSGRNFPTWSEILEVLTQTLGYQKVAAPDEVEPVAAASRPARAVAGSR